MKGWTFYGYLFLALAVGSSLLHADHVFSAMYCIMAWVSFATGEIVKTLGVKRVDEARKTEESRDFHAEVR